MKYSHTRSNHLRLVLCLLSVLLIGGAALAGDVGRCLSADIPAPVILPDGDVVAAGKLTICYRVAYSPVSGLEEISINGRSFGMFLSRSTEGVRPERIEGVRRDERTVLIFFRNDLEQLELFSYHRPMGERMLHHVFGSRDEAIVDSYWKLASKDAAGKKKSRKRNKRKTFDLAAVMQVENVVILSAVGP